jgi:predicted metal-dependent hydrolase
MQIPFLISKGLVKEKSQTQSYELIIDDVAYPVEITRNKRATRLTLRLVTGKQQLRVTAPPRVPKYEIVEFIERNKNWARTRLERTPTTLTIEEGAQIPIRGINYRIEISGKRRGTAELISQDGEDILLVHGDEAHVERRVRDFMKKQARLDLESAVYRHAYALDVEPTAIQIRDTKTRWGSCSSSGKLSFSWRIIMAPPQILDYLAAHEVAHLREMNHSSRFWNLVEDICPHMKASKAWLRKYGAQLHAVEL